MIFQRTFPPTGCENIPVAFYLPAIVEGGKGVFREITLVLLSLFATPLVLLNAG